MKNQQELIPYEEVFRALNKAGINYVVCGGAAVILFGFPRLTIDLDLIVDLKQEHLEKLYNALMKLDYRPKIPIRKEQFIQKQELRQLAQKKNMKVVSFYNLKDSFKVIDIGVNLPKIYEILRRKKYIKVKNLVIPIIAIDDLIKMKRDLARPQDLIDVQNLKRIKQKHG